MTFTLTPTRRVQAAGTAALLAFAAAGWVFLLDPRLGRAADIQAKAAALRASNDRTEQQLADLRAKQANLPAERAYAAALARRFPPTAAQPELFAEIRAAAGRAGIPESAVTSLAPSVPQPRSTPTPGATAPPTAGSQLASMPLTLSVTAPYDRLVAFIAELERMPRAYLISTVDIAPAAQAGADSYRLSVSGSLFAMPAPPDPTTPATATPTPVATTTPTTPRPTPPAVPTGTPVPTRTSTPRR